MALVSLQSVSLGFGGPLLLDEINLQIEAGEWIGLLGRNGAGKSSLLKVLSGSLQPDDGKIVYQQNTRVAYLPQEVPLGLCGNIESIVASGLEHLSNHKGDLESQWQQQLQVDQIISRMQLDPDADFQKLSAGMKRRVLLAKGLVNNPHLLLLDEPTNHLDLQAITWLEDFLARWDGTLLFVTHDRAFLKRLARRIIELDRGRLFDWNCDYQTFVDRKESMLAAEQAQNILFDKKLAQEEAWIRRGIEARRTRNEGRVRALRRLREIRKERREQPAKILMQIQQQRPSGKLVIEAENVNFGYNNVPVVKNFSTVVQRGDRVGIVGPNGSGKTTLLRLLLGELTPNQGEVRLGTNLEILYFDQLRAQLDENKTVYENVGQGGDYITIDGRSRPLYGYLEDFLFSPDESRALVSTLSGGERNRLLLARLFTRPANLLVLDEPTNDLDLETLELLEDLLLQFKGTLLIVSHDRAFLDNLVTSLLVLDVSSYVQDFIGGYEDWQNQKDSADKTIQQTKEKKGKESATNREKQRLSYQEKRVLEAKKQELAELPTLIEKLEEQQVQLTMAMAQPAFYQQGEEQISTVANRLKDLEDQLQQAYKHWSDLESELAE